MAGARLPTAGLLFATQSQRPRAPSLALGSSATPRDRIAIATTGKPGGAVVQEPGLAPRTLSQMTHSRATHAAKKCTFMNQKQVHFYFYLGGRREGGLDAEGAGGREAPGGLHNWVHVFI
jgi:hypothetical protein